MMNLSNRSETLKIKQNTKKKTLQFTYKALYSKVKEGNESVKGVRKR